MESVRGLNIYNAEKGRISAFIIRIVDWFYIVPLRKIMPIDTFRYAACGGGNLAMNLVIFAIFYNFIFRKEVIDLGFWAMSAHTASLVVASTITFFTGFWLNRHIAFQLSPLRGRTQLFRYGLSFAGSFLVNYLLLNLFVKVLHLYPTPSQALISVIVTGYSYLMQRFFSFRGFKK